MTIRSCSACGGKTKWRIDPFAIPKLEVVAEALAGNRRIGDVATTPLPVAADHPVQGKYSRVATNVGVLYLDVCAACGRAELWAKDFDRLTETDDGTVRRLEAGGGESTPYR